jgi:hypothetical protein
MTEQLQHIDVPHSDAGTADGGDDQDAGVRPTIVMSGPADHEAITRVAKAISDLISTGVRHLSVDVSGVYDVEVELLTMFACTRAALATAFAVEGSLTIVGVKLPQFLPAMRDAQVDEVFLVYDAIRHGRSWRPGAVRT